jgi:hypothetical protein
MCQVTVYKQLYFTFGARFRARRVRDPTPSGSRTRRAQRCPQVEIHPFVWVDFNWLRKLHSRKVKYNLHKQAA